MSALLQTTLKMSAILLVALMLVWLLRKRTASLRHAVLLIALACAALVPAVGLLLPSWASRDIVVSAFEALDVSEPHAAATPMRPAPSDHAAAATRSAPQASPQIGMPTVPAVKPPAATSHGWRASVPRVLEAARSVYLVGLCISLLMLVIGLLRLRALAGRCEPLHSDYWQWQASEIADAYRLRRPVQLARSANPSLLLIWGVRQPQLLLPAGAEDWPEDRIRAVLLHELAHVQRNDWIVQVLAGLLRAVYWFNPLLWIVCMRLRLESEQACDDAAIELGVTATTYAAHLLALARTIMRPVPTLSAPSMAHRSTLRRRIARILDPATRRSRMTRASVARIATALLLVTCAVAACHVARPPMRVADMQPRQAGTAGIAHHEIVPAVAAAPEPTVATVRPVVAHVDLPKSEAPLPEEAPTPRMVAAGILDLLQSALADDSSTPLSQFDYMMQTIRAVQRRSQLVIEDDGHDPSTLPTQGTALLNALGNAVNAADGIATRNNRPRLSTPKFERLAADLRAKSVEFSDALLPVPTVTSIEVATPAHRLAISVLDPVQVALDDAAFVGPHLHNWLWVELNTLERAAQSVVHDDGVNRGAMNTKLYALLSSATTTQRNAYGIADRADETEEVRSKAKNLATSVSATALQLKMALQPQPSSLRKGYDLNSPDEVVPTGASNSTIPGVSAQASDIAAARIAMFLAQRRPEWKPVGAVFAPRCCTAGILHASWTDETHRLEISITQEASMQDLQFEGRSFQLRQVTPPNRSLAGVGDAAQLFELQDRVEVGFTSQRDLLYIVMQLHFPLADGPQKLLAGAPPLEVDRAIALVRDIASASAGTDADH